MQHVLVVFEHEEKYIFFIISPCRCPAPLNEDPNVLVQHKDFREHQAFSLEKWYDIVPHF